MPGHRRLLKCTLLRPQSCLNISIIELDPFSLGLQNIEQTDVSSTGPGKSQAPCRASLRCLAPCLPWSLDPHPRHFILMFCVALRPGRTNFRRLNTKKGGGGFRRGARVSTRAPANLPSVPPFIYPDSIVLRQVIRSIHKIGEPTEPLGFHLG